ncbi:MAG: hydrogenase [Bacillales bacterium]|jgi:hydrogenase expression/formation protein HypE|nr:hydrogenase [Bacillales bacterium]
MEKLVTLAHGDGGELAHRLIQEVFVEAFKHNDHAMMDAALLTLTSNEVAITTDSFVVSPIFFPGGDIGKIAVAGTVNDLAVSGAKPLYLTSAFIIEEGFKIKDLQTIVKSMVIEASKSGVKIVAGDTKVVERGKCDGIFINTTGIGVKYQNSSINPFEINEGDSVIVSGTVGDHGIAILTARNELGLINNVQSDCASLSQVIEKLINSGINIKIMRDPTRGGLATTLVEICEDFNVTITLEADEIPVKNDVLGACELLGFEPIYLANEGKFILIIAKEDESKALDILRADDNGVDAKVIGSVQNKDKGQLLLTTVFGSTRRLSRLSGMLLPRIC